MGELNAVSFEARNEANECFDYGLTFEMKKDFDKAYAQFKKAIELDPNFAEAYNKIGDVFMKKGKFADAIANYEKSAELKPDIENTHFDLGCAFSLVNRLDDAVAEFEKALKLDPNHFEIYGMLGALFAGKGEFEKALQYLHKASVADPANVQARYFKGMALKGLGKKSEADSEFFSVIEKYKGLIETKVNYAEGYFFSAMASFHMGKLEDAERQMRRAIELDTEKIDHHYSFGLYYSDADAFYEMANIENAMGKTAEAREHLKKAQNLEPGNLKYKSLRQ